MGDTIYKWLKGWEYDIPTGWFIAFGGEMLLELNNILKRYNYQDKYEIFQVKEKFGMLRWYSGNIPEDMYIEYDAWLHKYEQLSKEFCYHCGKPATHTTTGWILPVCDDCYNK